MFTSVVNARVSELLIKDTPLVLRNNFYMYV